MIHLKEKDFKNFELLNSNNLNTDSLIYIVDDNTIYKIFLDNEIFYQEKIETISYLINKNIDFAILPQKLIMLNGNIIGYKLPYLKDYHTLKDLIDNDYTYKDKINIINNIYDALKKIHSLGLYLGDIHLDNFLVKDNNGYIIDFDQARFIDDKLSNQPLYFLKVFNNKPKIIKENYYTDNIKTMICSLSFLYNVNLEQLVFNNSVIDIINNLNIDNDLKFNLINILYNTETIYFDDVLNKQKNKQRIL